VAEAIAEDRAERRAAERHARDATPAQR
jgi:hypothetical protein